MVFLLCLTARTSLIRSVQIEATDGYDTTALRSTVCVIYYLLVLKNKK